MEILALTNDELITINGGKTAYSDGYKAGHSAGAFVGEIIKGVGVLSWVWSFI